jgi:hypothetical protein
VFENYRWLSCFDWFKTCTGKLGLFDLKVLCRCAVFIIRAIATQVFTQLFSLLKFYFLFFLLFFTFCRYRCFHPPDDALIRGYFWGIRPIIRKPHIICAVILINTCYILICSAQTNIKHLSNKQQTYFLSLQMFSSS